MGELWAAWAELEWEAGNEDLCLQVLTMAAGLQRGSIGELRRDVVAALTDSRVWCARLHRTSAIANCHAQVETALYGDLLELSAPTRPWSSILHPD